MPIRWLEKAVCIEIKNILQIKLGSYWKWIRWVCALWGNGVYLINRALSPAVSTRFANLKYVHLDTMSMYGWCTVSEIWNYEYTSMVYSIGDMKLWVCINGVQYRRYETMIVYQWCTVSEIWNYEYASIVYSIWNMKLWVYINGVQYRRNETMRVYQWCTVSEIWNYEYVSIVYSIRYMKHYIILVAILKNTSFLKRYKTDFR